MDASFTHSFCFSSAALPLVSSGNRASGAGVEAVIGSGFPTDIQFLVADISSSPNTILSLAANPQAAILALGLSTLALGVGTLYFMARARHEAFLRKLAESRLRDSLTTPEGGSKLAAEVESRTAELRKAAMTDKLTGLPNRSMFFERLQKSVQNASQRNASGQPSNYAVLFIDFDRFKHINDTLGHAAGDQLLIMIGQRLRSALSSFGQRVIAARLGGDEFAVLLEELKDSKEASTVAQNLMDAFAPSYQIEGREVVSSASVGITMSNMGYQRAEDVLRDADTAMYRSKAAGRARVTIFDPAMHEDEARRMAFQSELGAAIEHNQLVLHYQPIISIATGDIAGAESLLRWRHPTRGLISPSEFISIAEESGLIVQVGLWAIEEACHSLNFWNGQRAPLLNYLSVNLSPRQMVEESFIIELEKLLTRTSVDRHRLVIEVAEGVLMHDLSTAARVLTSIRNLGVKVFIDDYGVGASSLTALRQVTVDGIKLDRSFLDESVTSRPAAAILHSATTLAQDLNLQIVAEGVECLEQLALLQALGFEHAQGYLFSRPVGHHDFDELLAQPPLRTAA